MKINLKVYEFSVLIQQIARGEHQMAMQVFMSPGEATYIIANTVMPGQFLSKSTGYDNAELNALMAASFLETEEAKLKDLYGKMQAIMARDAPIGVLGFVHASNLWRQGVKDFTVNQALTMNVGEVKV